MFSTTIRKRLVLAVAAAAAVAGLSLGNAPESNPQADTSWGFVAPVTDAPVTDAPAAKVKKEKPAKPGKPAKPTKPGAGGIAPADTSWG